MTIIAKQTQEGAPASPLVEKKKSKRSKDDGGDEDGEDDDEDWSQDTSEEAVRARREQVCVHQRGSGSLCWAVWGVFGLRQMW
jgi:hypothetical protein